jgi:hypothetical protein
MKSITTVRYTYVCFCVLSRRYSQVSLKLGNGGVFLEVTHIWHFPSCHCHWNTVFLKVVLLLSAGNIQKLEKPVFRTLSMFNKNKRMIYHCHLNIDKQFVSVGLLLWLYIIVFHRMPLASRPRALLSGLFVWPLFLSNEGGTVLVSRICSICKGMCPQGNNDWLEKWCQRMW